MIQSLCRCKRSIQRFIEASGTFQGVRNAAWAGDPSPPWKRTYVHQGQRPFRLAVLGSGPAGFYTAYKVMSKIGNAFVDMFEHLPVPFGLVRYGVAPGHPEVKVSSVPFASVSLVNRSLRQSYLIRVLTLVVCVRIARKSLKRLLHRQISTLLAMST